MNIHLAILICNLEDLNCMTERNGMKRTVAILLTLCLLIPIGYGISEGSDAGLDEAVGKIFKQYKVTGGQLVIALRGEIVYQRNYGYAYTLYDKELVDDGTYFKVASVTKLVSAIHVMQLVEQGKLDLDADISNYLGYDVVNFKYSKIPITLRTLMSHTSSLSTSGGYSKESNKLGALIAKKNKRKANFKKYAPGSAYEYSNFGAGIMGSLVETVTGKNVNESIREELFTPLGIDASYTPTMLEHPEKITSIFTTSGKAKFSRSKMLKNPWDDSVNPEKHYRITVGDLWIKGRDLCRLGILLCNGGELDGLRILQPETVEEMMSSQMGKGAVTCDPPYGLCVNRVTNLLEDRMVYGHQGLTDYVVCNLYFDPETEFVFAMVTNGASTKMNDHIGILTRKMFELAWSEFVKN